MFDTRRHLLQGLFAVALLLLAGGWYLGRSDIDRELTHLYAQETLNVGLGVGAVNGKLDDIAGDLTFLSSFSGLRDALDQTNSANLGSLEETFVQFSRSKGVYDQLRWIDETGMERVRVDFQNGDAVRIPRDKLQQKGQRYFFTDSFKLAPGEIFISPLDLNIEQNKIEEPIKPMVRIATPVVDSRGVKRGIVILNYFGRLILDSFAVATTGIGDHVMLLNGEGYWLKSSKPVEEWGFMFKKPELALAVRAPEAWQRIRGADSGQVKLADGTWTWKTVYPLVAGSKSSTGATEAFVPSKGGVDAKQYVWKSVAHLSAADLDAVSRRVWIKVVLVEMTLLGIIGAIGWKLGISITERKRVLETLRESEERHRMLADNAADVIWTMNLAGQFTYVSPSVERLRGYTPSEVMRQTLRESLTPGSAEIAQKGLMEGFEAIQKGEPFPCFKGQLEQPCKDGSTVWTEVATTGMTNSDGRFIGILGVTRDISERKKAEEEKHKLQAQLQQSQKMEGLGTLAGGVAHDMNNVLGAILGLASAHIGTQPYGSPVHKALDTICKAAERGGKMVKSLLSFARQTTVENLKVDLNVILRDQISLLERTTLGKVRLEIDLEATLRPTLGDASALSHAFMNICVNAVDAMPENGTLTLRTRNINNDWIEVEVEDNGIGMPKEVLEKAMEPFFTTKETGKGTGLGLSMVFSTVKAHRGHMAIESEPGLGTRVRLRFPAFEQEVPVQSTAPAAPETTLATQGSLKVLLIDDDDLILSSVPMILEVLGHTAVKTAQSGENALAKLQEGFDPDFVIMDMNMPGLGGIGTLPRLRALRPEVPVLLATGRVDQTALTLASAHPGVTLLPKPYGLRELQKHLETIGLG